MLCSLMDSKIELDRNVNKHWMCEIYRYIDTVPSRPTIVPIISLIVSFQFESSAAILTRAFLPAFSICGFFFRGRPAEPLQAHSIVAPLGIHDRAPAGPWTTAPSRLPQAWMPLQADCGAGPYKSMDRPGRRSLSRAP